MVVRADLRVMESGEIALGLIGASIFVLEGYRVFDPLCVEAR